MTLPATKTNTALADPPWAAIVTCIGSTPARIATVVLSTDTVDVYTWNAAGVAEDAAFSIAIF